MQEAGREQSLSVLSYFVAKTVQRAVLFFLYAEEEYDAKDKELYLSAGIHPDHYPECRL